MFSSSLEKSSRWWVQPIWKVLVKIGSFSPSRGENKNSLKPPPSHFRLQHGMMCFWNIWHKAFTMGRSKQTIHHLCNSIHLVSAAKRWAFEGWCDVKNLKFGYLVSTISPKRIDVTTLLIFFSFGFHYLRHLNISFWLQQQKVFPIQFTWTTNQPNMTEHTTCIPFGNQKR